MQECIDHGKSGSKEGYSYRRLPISRKQILRHRLAYCEHHNITLDDIEGYVIRHSCDNPRCINPLHLLKGTHADNVQDKVSRNRQAKHEQNGRAVIRLIDAEWIRNNYVYGSRELGAPALARRFGINKTSVMRIIKGVNWNATSR